MGKSSSKRRAELAAEQCQRVKLRAEQPPAKALPIWPEKVEGGPLVHSLQRYAEQLRDRDAHGNQRLFLDDVFIAYLLAFFNPTIRSLRTIEDFSQTRQGQRHLSIPRICRSTQSDFNKIADPERLGPILAELRAALSRKFPGTPRNDDALGLLKKVIAVDGTYFSAMSDVAWAVGHRNQHAQKYRARVDLQIDVHTWLPEVIAVPEPHEGEAARAAKTVQAGAIHVYDRAYGSFELFEAHYEPDGETLRPKAEFVVRAKEKHLLMEVTEERELTAEQRALGIESDCIGRFKGSPGHKAPNILVREILIRGKDGELVRLLANVLDVDAEIIGHLYRLRWQIELFFRWLKCYANFNHLVSHNRNGALLHFYVTMIAAMLMYLHTGARPSKYTMAMFSVLANDGEDTLETILPILERRERQKELDRQSAARRRAKKKS